jgi:hypothetical protein
LRDLHLLIENYVKELEKRYRDLIKSNDNDKVCDICKKFGQAEVLIRITKEITEILNESKQT